MEVIRIIQKPYSISLKGVTIDAAEINVVTWKVSGAIQYSYAISILNNATNAVVYTVSKTASYLSSHFIPANTLTNNLQYKISIQVWDAGDASTALSDYDVFNSSSRPVITVATIGTVANQTNTFTATYTQAESVPIKSWIVYLYNSSSNIISQSGIQSTTTLSYLFGGFVNGQSYFVEFQATSNEGLTGTSGLLPFDTFYATPNLDVSLSIENVDDAGMKLSWDVVQIIGESNNPIYISGESLDTRHGNKAWFDTGYSISNNFTLKTWISGLTNNTISDNGEIIVSSVAPTNINALWQEDSTQTTPITVSISVRDVEPTSTGDFWIQDVAQTTERILGLFIGSDEPTSSFAWINQESFVSSSKIINLIGDNGRLVIDYYNGYFHLSSYDLSDNKTVLNSVSATGSLFYVYIQQIEDTYTLGVTVLS